MSAGEVAFGFRLRYRTQSRDTHAQTLSCAAGRVLPGIRTGRYPMPKTDRYLETFAALRSILQPHAKQLTVTVDEPDHYALASPTMTDRIGRPLPCASVQINKNYVSYHLL